MLIEKNYQLKSWILLSFTFLMTLSGCEFLGIGGSKDPLYDPHNTPTCRYVNYNHDTKTGKKITYYESGKKKSVSYEVNGSRDSLYRSWYENGNKKLNIWYNKGYKEGLYQYFREGGELYREIEYENDEKHGLYQEFWKNGRVKYSLMYDRGMKLHNTLREFKSSGKIKPGSYLVIEEKNTVRLDNQYTLYVYFPELPEESQYIAVIDGVEYILPKENGKGVQSFNIPPNYYYMKKIRFIGRYLGRKNTIQQVERLFNVGIENI